MSDTPAEVFSTDVAEMFSRRVKDFAEWIEKEWKLTPEEGAKELDMTPDQVEGWNKCCESMVGAAGVWLEEYNP